MERGQKILSRIIVCTCIWLVECSPSLRSECMVLPYLKGLINKEAFISISILLFLGMFVSFHIFSYQIYNISGLDLQQVVSELYFWVISITSGIRAITSGISAITSGIRAITSGINKVNHFYLYSDLVIYRVYLLFSYLFGLDL